MFDPVNTNWWCHIMTHVCSHVAQLSAHIWCSSPWGCVGENCSVFITTNPNTHTGPSITNGTPVPAPVWGVHMDTAVEKAGRLSWVWVCRVMVFVREGTNKTVFVCFFLPTFGISGNSDRKQLSGDCVVGLVFWDTGETMTYNPRKEVQFE